MYADIRVVDGQLVYGLEDCTCVDGKVYGSQVCSACKGTCRTKGGMGKGTCTKCIFGKVTDFDPAHRITCGRCNGTIKIQSNSCSYLPLEIYQSLPFRVFRSDRPQTWNEAWLGHGTVFSVNDYGSYKTMSDEELIAHVRGIDHSVQACKIANRENKLCTYLCIYCNDNGYSVIAVYE